MIFISLRTRLRLFLRYLFGPFFPENFYISLSFLLLLKFSYVRGFSLHSLTSCLSFANRRKIRSLLLSRYREFFFPCSYFNRVRKESFSSLSPISKIFIPSLRILVCYSSFYSLRNFLFNIFLH